jgi:hypothetical protein
MAERAEARGREARDELRRIVGFSAADEIETLHSLKANGAISEQEYAKPRARLISRAAVRRPDTDGRDKVISARLLSGLETLLERPVLVVPPGIGQQAAGQAGTGADTGAEGGIPRHRANRGAARRANRRACECALLARRKIRTPREECGQDQHRKHCLFHLWFPRSVSM